MTTTIASQLAEVAIIGSMIVAPELADTILGVISAADFADFGNTQLFVAITELYNSSTAVTTVTIADQLNKLGVPELISRIPDIVAGVELATPATVKAYAEIVADTSARTKLTETASRFAATVMNPSVTLSDSLTVIAGQLADIDASRYRETVTPATLSEDALTRLDARMNGEASPAITTGWSELDGLLSGGLRPGRLYYVAARPAMGKSVIATNLAWHIAASGKPVYFASLEMPKEEVTDRFLIAAGAVDASRYDQGFLDEGELGRIQTAAETFSGLPITIDDDSNVTVQHILTGARRVKAQHGTLGLVVVDYIQLMGSGAKRYASRQEEIADMSRNLKLLARQIEAPVVALAQVSREVDKRSDKRPLLSDLRESGSLEADADAVILLYRDEVYDPASPDAGLMELNIAKQRAGRTGTVKLGWMGNISKAVSLQTETSADTPASGFQNQF